MSSQTEEELLSCLDPDQGCKVELVLSLSDYCMETGNSTCCYAFNEDDTLNTFAGVWCIINAVVGISGNLLTLLAIPMAKKKKRFGFHNSCNCTTWFVMNLAFSDLIYCSFCLPLYTVQYLRHEWPFGKRLCYAFAAFRYINAFAEWMSIAFIAVSRCACLLWKKWVERHCSGLHCLVVIVLIWAYAIGIVSPTFAEYMGTFGFNCRSGKCDYIQLDPEGFSHQLYYGITFSVPCIIIFTSYAIIWWYIKLCNLYLKRLSTGSNPMDQTERQEIKLTWTLLGVSLCYIVCVGPLAIMNMIDPYLTCQYVYLCIYAVYWLQYSLNFFIYALWNKQFRSAYVDFFLETWGLIRNLYRKVTFRKGHGDPGAEAPPEGTAATSGFCEEKVVLRVQLEFSQDGDLRRMRVTQRPKKQMKYPSCQ